MWLTCCIPLLLWCHAQLDEKEFREVIGLLKEADGWEDDGKDQ